MNYTHRNRVQPRTRRVISDYLADTISRNILVTRREIIIIGARSIKRFEHIGTGRRGGGMGAENTLE